MVDFANNYIGGSDVAAVQPVDCATVVLYEILLVNLIRSVEENRGSKMANVEQL